MAYVPKIRKAYYPFDFLLRSAPYEGKGAVVAENCKLHDGRLVKVKAAEEWTEIAGAPSILHGYSYKKNDGTEQKFVAFADNDYFTIRAINDDKTLTTPTLPEANEAAITGTMTFTSGSAAVSAAGGAFTSELSVGDLVYLDGEYASRANIASITDDDNLVLTAVYAGTGGAGSGKRSSPHYTNTLFSFRQIGKYLFVGNDSTTIALARWSGTTLTPSSNAPDEIKFLARDKNRLVAGEPRQTGFSETDFATSNDWEGGTGSKVHGVYKTEIIVPKAGIEAGSGIVISGEIGADAQKVIPNNASDDISADTSLDGFTSLEKGVSDNNKVCAAGGFVFKINPDGIHQMNPFTGESINLTDTGEIGRKWKNYTTINAVIAYDIENEWVVACLQLGARNDTLLCIDISKENGENRPIFTVPNSYYSSLFVSGGELFAGDSASGKIHRVFQSARSAFRYSQEWDGIDLPVTKKKIKKLSVFANASPLSTFIGRVYVDGSSTHIWEETFKVSEAARGMSDAGYECYVFESGSIELFTKGVDYMKRTKPRAKFSTIRFEIVNDDQYDFELLDVVIEYKAKSKLIRSKSMNRL